MVAARALRILFTSFILFGVSSFISAPVASAESQILEPTRDTYVDEKIPNASYGTIGLGVVGYENASTYTKIALFHFDLNTIPAGSTISSAKLTLRLGGCTGTASGAGHMSFGGYLTTGSPAWTESSTYQQLSTSGSSLDGIGSQIVSCDPGAYIDFDVTELTKAWVDRAFPNDGLYLSPVSGGSNWTRVFYMREATASSRPKLTVNYDVPYEVVDAPDGGPLSASASPSPSTNTSKAHSNAQPIDPDESLVPPTKLTATQVSGSKEVELRWEKSSSENVEYYRIFRVDLNGNAVDTKVGEISGSENSFIDKETEAGKSYSYFVRAVRSQRESVNTDAVQITIEDSTKVSQSVPEELQKTNNQLSRQLILSLIFAFLAVLALVILAVKHRRLHRKHKALTKS